MHFYTGDEEETNDKCVNMRLQCVAEGCNWESQDLNEGLAEKTLVMHLPGRTRTAAGRRPGTSRGGSRRKLAALPTRERQNTAISDLQGLDNPGRGQDGVLGDHGEQAEDRLPQIQRRG